MCSNDQGKYSRHFRDIKLPIFSLTNFVNGLWLNGLLTLANFVSKNVCDIMMRCHLPQLPWPPWAKQNKQDTFSMCSNAQGKYGRHYHDIKLLIVSLTNFVNGLWLNGLLTLANFVSRNVCDIMMRCHLPQLPLQPWAKQNKQDNFSMCSNAQGKYHRHFCDIKPPIVLLTNFF